MTEVLLVCGKDGCFKSCEAHGHSLFAARGTDIVCAAESFLLRTAVDVLEHTEGLTVKTEAASRGHLAFCVEAIDTSSPVLTERLRCTADFIRNGIKSLSEEYPRNVQLHEKVL